MIDRCDSPELPAGMNLPGSSLIIEDILVKQPGRVIYIARARDGGSRQIVKYFSRRGDQIFDRREQLRREAEIVQANDHPALLSGRGPIVAAGDARGGEYIVLEHIDGPSLADRLLHGPLPPADLLRLAARLAGGLEHFHRRGLLHLDIAPANIMLGHARPDEAVLIDFGTARHAGAAPRQGPLGKPSYAAPELRSLRARPIPRSDIFALGRTLMVAAGAVPTSSRWQKEPVLTRLPPALASLLGMMSATDPRDRPASASDLLLRIADAGKTIGVSIDQE